LTATDAEQVAALAGILGPGGWTAENREFAGRCVRRRVHPAGPLLSVSCL